MFCIDQIDDKMTEKIIKVINSENEFLSAVKELIPDNLKFKLLEGINTYNILHNNCFIEDYYLLVNDKQIKLVHKCMKINKGIIYNSPYIDVDTLFTWKLLPFECDQPEFNVKFKDDIQNYDTSETMSNDSDMNYSNGIYEQIHTEVNNNSENTENSENSENSDDDSFFSEKTQINNDCIFEKTSNKNKTCSININGTNNSLQIQSLKLKTLCKNPSICIIAKRGSGKSWIIRNIFDELNTSSTSDRFIENTLVISPTERMSKFYRNFIPKENIIYEYDKTAISTYLNTVRHLNKQNGNESFQGCIIMDDCLASKSQWMNDPEILELFYNSRHYGIAFIVTFQFPLGLRPELRCNFDYVFLLKEDFYSNQKRLYDHYGGMFPTFELFRQVFMQLTENFGCMVINNRGAQSNITDKIFHFKASEPKQLYYY